MNNINKQAFTIRQLTIDDYLNWCKKKKWPSYKTSTKKEFFARIDDGRLVKNEFGELVEKRKRKQRF